ncbi:MAG: efflux RND transporter periplasmic adaptor subunit, partial [Candidatus Hydrothermales bacterium]
MKLVERKMIFRNNRWEPYEEEIKDKQGIKISPHKELLIGIKRDTVKKRNLTKIIRTYGKIDYDERRIFEVNLKFGGWIEKLYTNFEGKFIQRDSKLFEIYSPELYQNFNELLLSIEKEDTSLFKNVKHRLLLLGIREFQIEKIVKDKRVSPIISFYSPYEGFIIEKNIFEGMKVEPGLPLFKIVDLKKVWILGEIYEYEGSLIKEGYEVPISFLYNPNLTLKGKVKYIYPYLNPEKRTNRIVIEVLNKDYLLKPNKFVNLEIKIDYGEKLVIPSSSV